MKLENLKCIGGENDILREGSFRSEIKGCKFFARQYGSPIESDYYNPRTGTNGGNRIVTKDICALCMSMLIL